MMMIDAKISSCASKLRKTHCLPKISGIGYTKCTQGAKNKRIKIIVSSYFLTKLKKSNSNNICAKIEENSKFIHEISSGTL